MLNVTKAAPQFLSKHTTFLNKMLAPSATPMRAFSSVAFNVKSKFEDAFLRKREAAANVPKKE